ncbi:MAG TPA: right-handed parallel beta-helix repeat-containing protein [Candidatus Thermoplasmatota archaeon]|nr:right-handed parallel beta-helix repeat-containing protein [Candidatus Thermoplasmatota archaeon]
MKKFLVVGITLLFIGIAIIPSTAQNIEKSSLSRGHWLYVGGSGPGNYSIIQNAVDNASNGDTVYVYSGWYDRSSGIDYCVYLNKSISLVGENKNTTILTGSWEWAVVKIAADDVEIKGFTIQNLEYGGRGILTSYPEFITRKNITIHDNIFMRNGMWGLDMVSCFNLTCYDNMFTENWVGCRVLTSGNVTLTHNFFISNEWGISIESASGIEVSWNEFKENEYGLDNFGDGHGNALRCVSNNFIDNTIQADFYIVFSLIHIPRMVKYRAQWSHNYWSDWGQTSPRPIEGTLFYRNILFYYLLIKEIPWSEYDWHPVKEPYDIP